MRRRELIKATSRGWAGRGSTPAWRRLRQAVLDRDSHQCMIRGRNCTAVATTVDHIVSLADGGSFLDPNNCRAACGPCNYGRRDSASPAARSTTVEVRTLW